MKNYVVAERWVVEVRYNVEAESETEACKKIGHLYPKEEEYIEVIETIVDEIKVKESDNE